MPAVMNQDLALQHFSLTPDLTAAAHETTLARLLVPGVITDGRIDSRCRQLDERFRTFVATCPAPAWAPGLQIDAEIRRQYELYLPLAEIAAALADLCRLACRYEPRTTATAVAASLSWPDALARLRPFRGEINPARLLQRLAAAEQDRFAFLAALFIPRSFGGSFSRYPLQAEFLCRWLRSRKKRLQGKVAVLDAACGSGEGTYAAAAAVLQLGFSVSGSLVEGSTLEPLELAAAAHGWFPQDKERSLAFREQVKRLLACGAGGMMLFSREDLCNPLPTCKGYDVIICNGLLGGPLLHERETLRRVISLLAARLNPGGILLAADRFHEGWKQTTPSATIQELLTASGLQSVAAGEGLGGVRTG